MPAYTLENNCIILHRELTPLDIFVKDFLAVLQKHSRYLIVSGYVSIVTGRTRGTEDVDILVPLSGFSSFERLFLDLSSQFWCYQGDQADTTYPYLKDSISIRFARKGEVFPNIEFIPITPVKKLKWLEFQHPQRMKIKDFEFLVSPLEFEILYKEKILGSQKDLADAKHLRTLFSAILSNEKLKEYATIIGTEL